MGPGYAGHSVRVEPKGPRGSSTHKYPVEPSRWHCLEHPRLRVRAWGSCQALPSPSGFLSAHQMGRGARSLGRWAPVPAGSPETDPLLQLLICPLALARLPGKLGKLLCSPNLEMRHRCAQVSFLALCSALTPDSAQGAPCDAGEEARSTTRTACAFAVLSLCPHTIPWDEPNPTWGPESGTQTVHSAYCRTSLHI